MGNYFCIWYCHRVDKGKEYFIYKWRNITFNFIKLNILNIKIYSILFIKILYLKPNTHFDEKTTHNKNGLHLTHNPLPIRKVHTIQHIPLEIYIPFIISCPIYISGIENSFHSGQAYTYSGASVLDDLSAEWWWD